MCFCEGCALSAGCDMLASLIDLWYNFSLKCLGFSLEELSNYKSGVVNFPCVSGLLYVIFMPC